MIYGAGTRRGEVLKGEGASGPRGRACGSPRWCHLAAPAPLQRPPSCGAPPAPPRPQLQVLLVPPSHPCAGPRYPFGDCALLGNTKPWPWWLSAPPCAPQTPPFCGVAPSPGALAGFGGLVPRRGSPQGFALLSKCSRKLGPSLCPRRAAGLRALRLGLRLPDRTEHSEDQKMGFQGFLFFTFFCCKNVAERGRDGGRAAFPSAFPPAGAGSSRGLSPRAQRQRRTSCDSSVTARRHYF